MPTSSLINFNLFTEAGAFQVNWYLPLLLILDCGETAPFKAILISNQLGFFFFVESMI